MVGSLTPNLLGGADSQTRTLNLLLLVEGTCHRTKARPLVIYKSNLKVKSIVNYFILMHGG